MVRNSRFARFFGVAAAIAAFAAVSSAQVIYSNGGLATGATSRSGVAAPAGTQWAEVQSNTGDTVGSNTNSGVGCQVIGVTTDNRCADDFIVPRGETWTVNSITLYVYQTGFAGVTSPVTAVNMRIWNGVPEAPGSTIVFGDTTTNRLGTSVNSNLFRVFNSTVPAPGTVPGTTRIIWETTANVAPAAVLPAGYYWVEFQIDAGASGNFAPGVTTVGSRGSVLYNGIQKIGAAAFAGIIEGGNPAAIADYGIDFPFKVNGTVAGTIGPRRSRTVDFNGDNKTDFGIARSASVAGQTTWQILDSTAAVSGAAWGTGVGFAGGDRAVPEDFDGDGKTDIAVWRPGAATVASFYILQSATSTLRAEAFGQTGDDPSVVDDYDGDGKADLAVYRDGGAGQSFFYYRSAANGPVTYVPWGIGGDKPAPGDYDGDGKADFAVYRNEAGSARHYHMRSTEGFVTVQFGLFTDKFVAGDYDGDNKTDICAVRANGSVFDWYLLRSGNGTLATSASLGGFGNPTTDYITPGDYDGDNKTDFAVWRTAVADNGVFYLAPSNSALSGTKWGSTSGILTAPDYPVANYNVH